MLVNFGGERSQSFITVHVFQWVLKGITVLRWDLYRQVLPLSSLLCILLRGKKLVFRRWKDKKSKQTEKTDSNVYVIFPTIVRFSLHSVSIFIQMLQFLSPGPGTAYAPECPPLPIAGCESTDFWLRMMFTAVISNFCLLAAHVS